MTLKNNYKFRLNGTLTTSWTSVAIGNDLISWTAVSLDAGTNIGMKDRTGKNLELMTVSASWWTLTISARWLDEDGSADATLKKYWSKGTIVYVTILNTQLFDRTQDNTITDGKKINFWWTSAYIWTENTGTDLKFKDASNSERTLSDLSASWSDEKIKISSNDTTAAYLDTKITGWDGITVTETNDGSNETLDFDVDITDTTVFVTTATASKVPVLNGSGYITAFINSDGAGYASTSEAWLSEMSSDAEATAATDQSRYINPKQAKDNYETITDWAFATIALESTNTVNVTFAKTFKRAPKHISMEFPFSNSWSSIMEASERWMWSADRHNGSYVWYTVTTDAWNDTFVSSTSHMLQVTDWGWDAGTITISNVTTTWFDIVNTATGASTIAGWTDSLVIKRKATQ